MSSALTRIEMSEWMHKYEWWDGYISVWDSWSKLGILPDIYSSAVYSKLSIKCLVLLNDLVWIFQEVSIKRPGPSQKKIDRTVLFQGCHSQFLGSIKRPGLDTWKKSLLNDQVQLRKNLLCCFISGLPRPIFGFY